MIKTILIGLVASLLRSGAGWWENAAHEKSHGGEKITKFELAKLGETTARVTILTLSVYLPLNAFGLDGAGLAAAGSAVALDFLLRALKTKKMVIEEST